MTSKADNEPSWEPINNLAVPSGYTASAQIQTNRQDNQITFQELSKAAARIQEDPLKVQQLADRIYQLMLEDLHQEKQRNNNYGGLF